jgi:hypothetical protein
VKRLTCVAAAGLCNRVQTLLGAKTLAAQTNRELAVFWRRCDACACEWQDLFQPSLTVLEREPRIEFSVLGPVETRGPIARDCIRAAFSPAQDVVFAAYEFGNPADHFHHFKSLFRPVDEVREAVAAKRQQFSVRMVGVHVRRGDFRAYPGHGRLQGKLAPVADYIQHAKMLMRQLGARKVFLASDDGAPSSRSDPTKVSYDGVYPSFVEALGRDAVVRHEKLALDRTAEGMRDALIDLLLLRECDAVCGQAGSSFARVAATGKPCVMLDCPSLAAVAR